MKYTPIKEELKELSPMLQQLKDKKDPMQVPPGYFEALHDHLQQIRTEYPQPAITGRWTIEKWKQPVLWSVAASTALLFTAYLFFQPIQSPPTTASFEPLTPDIASAYVEENILEFEPELLENPEDERLYDLINANMPSTAATSEPNLTEDQLLEEMTEEELRDLL